MAAFLALGSLAEAQQFQLEDYLKRKDTNQNGRVEPEEMSDNTRGFLRRMGFDTDKSLSISKIVSKASDDRKAADSKSAKPGRTRKVAGFAVDKTESSASVTRFGESGATKGSSTQTSQFSESVMKQVNDTLGRYDRNKDGSLDRDELKNARWGSPPPEQSDTNRDGRLTKDELANRYASREQFYRSSSSSNSDSRRSSSRSTDSQDQGRGLSGSSRYRPSSSSNSTSYSGSSRSSSWRSDSSRSDSSRSDSSRSTYSRSSTPSRTTSNVSSVQSSGDEQAKYEKYAESLIGQYDADKDGKLNSEETKKMRRPPAGADADKDGFITKSELVDSLSGTSKPTASEQPDKNDNKKVSRFGGDRGGPTTATSRGSSSRPGSSSSFEKLDANADRQVQMHEYATKWDDKTVDEFYSKDKNGDGVITLREWTGKN